MTDKEYIRRIAVNDQTAIAEFYDQVYPKFVQYFRNKFHKPEEYSMDLFHDSFMAMYDNILCGKLTPDTLTSSLYQYLLGIAIRKMQAGDRKTHVLDQVRLYHNGEGEDEFLDIKVQKQIVEAADNEDAERKYEEMKDFVERAVAELTPPCDELLRRFYWDRLSGIEIAQAMNYSNADSVKTQKNKCMKKLKPIVEQFRRL